MSINTGISFATFKKSEWGRLLNLIFWGSRCRNRRTGRFIAKKACKIRVSRERRNKKWWVIKAFSGWGWELQPDHVRPVPGIPIGGPAGLPRLQEKRRHVHCASYSHFVLWGGRTASQPFLEAVHIHARPAGHPISERGQPKVPREELAWRKISMRVENGQASQPTATAQTSKLQTSPMLVILPLTAGAIILLALLFRKRWTLFTASLFPYIPLTDSHFLRIFVYSSHKFCHGNAVSHFSCHEFSHLLQDSAGIRSIITASAIFIRQILLLMYYKLKVIRFVCKRRGKRSDFTLEQGIPLSQHCTLSPEKCFTAGSCREEITAAADCCG